jgi:hypothetical protein
MRDDEPRPVPVWTCLPSALHALVCVYHCSTYHKAVRGGGGGIVEDMCATRDDESVPRHVWTQRVFITAVPITKLFAWGGKGIVEDMCYERRQAEACVD